MDSTRPRSGSNTSTQELSADNIQILVNINSDKSESPHMTQAVQQTLTSFSTAIKLNVRPSHTVAHVLDFLSASTTLPTNARILLDDRQLQPSSTVGELDLKESSTLKLDPPASTQLPSVPATTDVKLDSASTVSSGAATPTRTAKKSNKPRCSKQGCKTFAQPIVGDCGFCQQRFCGKHRMLESHNCSGLDDARQADKDRNAAKLEGERTIMLRGL